MFKFYKVGGFVRDSLIGVRSKDIDYSVVTDDLTEEPLTVFYKLEEYLRQQGFDIFLSTPSCFTIRAKNPLTKETADYVLARKEIGYKPGTREPIVVLGTLYDDLYRRDFTINSLAESSDGIIIDYFNGQEHLVQGRIVPIISAEQSFNDDPLRILRAIRFAITKDFSIDKETSDVIHFFDYDNKMNVVSEERIREELNKMFQHNTRTTLGFLFRYTNLTRYIFKSGNLWLKPTNEAR